VFPANHCLCEISLLFDFNTESNVPTFFSSVNLLVAGILLFFIASVHKTNRVSCLYWYFLSAIFVYLSVDEIASLHERLMVPLSRVLNTSGIFFYSWVIPYGAAVMLLFGIYLKFLLQLPRKVLLLFVVSGVVFIGGAIGFELFGGWQHQLHGTDTILYAVLYTCEELLEMLGVILFIYSLLFYMTSNLNCRTIAFTADS